MTRRKVTRGPVGGKVTWLRVPDIAPSARKHRITDDDMRHALRNPVGVADLDDAPRRVHRPRPRRHPGRGGRGRPSTDRSSSTPCAPAEVPAPERCSLMPRSAEEILAHADELARRFEDYSPHPATCGTPGRCEP